MKLRMSFENAEIPIIFYNFKRLTFDLFACSLYCDHFPVSSPPGHLRPAVRATILIRIIQDGWGFFADF
jgi:hypothetical protein